MMAYTGSDMVAAMAGIPTGSADMVLSRRINGISTDSRSVSSGEVFIALKGEHADGTEFVRKAIGDGALFAVVTRDAQPDFDDLPVVDVPDTCGALGDAAGDYRARFTGTVVAITGSNGKTTVKELMLAVLGATTSVHGTRGNFNNHIGLPLSVFGLDNGHDCAVFELGMNSPGEIRRLVGIARPQVGVLLNAGSAHMEFFKSVDEVAEAKLELLEGIDADGTLVVNADDPLLNAGADRFGGRIIRFGCSSSADVRADDVILDDYGRATFTVAGQRVTLGVPGAHMVSNALAAWAVGMIMDVPPEIMVCQLAAFEAPKMRLSMYTRNGVIWINDAYNANPVSMNAALDVFAARPLEQGGRRIAVLGDMLELGDMAAEAHIAVGRKAAASGAAILVAVGEHAGEYQEGALAGGMQEKAILSYVDAESAGNSVRSMLRPGDVVLLKGSRGLGMERVIDAVIGAN